MSLNANFCILLYMLTAEEKVILQDYKKAFHGYYKNREVIDLDKKLARRAEWFLVRLSEVLPEIAMKVPPNKGSNFTIRFLTEGSGKEMVGAFAFDIKDRTLIVVPAFTVNSATFGDDCKGYDLNFNLRFFFQEYFPRHHLLEMDLFNPGFIPYAYVDFKDGKHLSEIFEIILDEKSYQRSRKEEMIALKVLELIILCERLLKAKKSGQKNALPPVAAKYVEMTKQQYRSHHAVSYYAKKLHIHPNQLNANTKRYLGLSAKAILDIMLVGEAEYLLLQTAFSVKEIAYELGFKSASHFFRFFKRHKGASPAAYRKQIVENVAN